MLCKDLRQESPYRAHHIDGLHENWTYEREKLNLGCYLRYCHRILGARLPPKSAVLKPVTPRSEWIVYFIYSPNGELSPYHRYTLNKLSNSNIPLFVIFACDSIEKVPIDSLEACDALYWKSLSGYDFSAYTIAVHEICKASAGANVLIMNDSVFGPFADLSRFINNARWDLTGFTACNLSAQRHIQSYAFIIKNIGERHLRTFRWVFSPYFAFNSAFGAISCQELWLARFASRHISVGAFWYGEGSVTHDPSLTRAIGLVDAGFPFMKRSLLAKHNQFQNRNDVIERLQRFNHPLDGLL